MVSFPKILLGLIYQFFFVAIILGIAGISESLILIKGRKFWAAILLGTLTAALFLGGTITILNKGHNQNIFLQFLNRFDAHWKQEVPVFLKAGISLAEIHALKQFCIRYFIFAFPAWLLLGCLILSILAYYLISLVFLKTSFKINSPVAFQNIVIPEPLIFGLILGGVLKLLELSHFKGLFLNSALGIIDNNLLVLFLGIYFIGGLTIIFFFLKRFKAPWFLRIIVYLLIIYWMNATIVFACALGIFDVWFDFRKIKSPLKPKASA